MATFAERFIEGDFIFSFGFALHLTALRLCTQSLLKKNPKERLTVRGFVHHAFLQTLPGSRETVGELSNGFEMIPEETEEELRGSSSAGRTANASDAVQRSELQSRGAAASPTVAASGPSSSPAAGGDEGGNRAMPPIPTRKGSFKRSGGLLREGLSSAGRLPDAQSRESEFVSGTSTTVEKDRTDDSEVTPGHRRNRSRGASSPQSALLESSPRTTNPFIKKSNSGNNLVGLAGPEAFRSRSRSDEEFRKWEESLRLVVR